MNISASPVSPRQGRPARADAGAAGPGQPRLRGVLQPGRRAGRARVRRLQPGRGPGRRAGGARRPVPRGADRVRHRPLDGGRRPPARRPPPSRRAGAAPGGHGPRAPRGSGAPRGDCRRGPARQAARGRRGGLRGTLPGAARLRRQERLRAGAAGALRRDRLGAHRMRGSRRARLRPGRMRGDALPPLLARDPERRPHAGRQPRDRALRDAPRAADGGLRRGALRALQRAPSRASPRRTSRPGSAATC